MLILFSYWLLRMGQVDRSEHVAKNDAKLLLLSKDKLLSQPSTVSGKFKKLRTPIVSA